MTETQNIIVVDTNILYSTPSLRHHYFQSLSDNAEKWGVKLVVPEVVYMETVKVVRRVWGETAVAVSNLKVGQFGMNSEKAVIEAKIQADMESYPDDLRERLASLGFEIVPVPNIPHIEIAERSAERRAPYVAGASDPRQIPKDGYRDTLIWLTVMDVAKSNPDAEVWFVSTNNKDFGPSGQNWTGKNLGSKTDCPINFSEELIDELTNNGIADRVHYVTTLPSLEQHLANQWAPVPNETLTRWFDQADQQNLADMLYAWLEGYPLDPEQSALPTNVLRASVVGADRPSDGWEFSEGARRGSNGGWTARFAVSVKVDISVIDSTGVTSEHTKNLCFSGVLSVDSSEAPESVEVMAATALPDDPNAELWVRRNARSDAYGSHSATLVGLATAMSGFKTAEFARLATAMSGFDTAEISGLRAAMSGFDTAKMSGLTAAMSGFDTAKMSGLAADTTDVVDDNAEGSTE